MTYFVGFEAGVCGGQLRQFFPNVVANEPWWTLRILIGRNSNSNWKSRKILTSFLHFEEEYWSLLFITCFGVNVIKTIKGCHRNLQGLRYQKHINIKTGLSSFETFVKLLYYRVRKKSHYSIGLFRAFLDRKYWV